VGDRDCVPGVVGGEGQRCIMIVPLDDCFYTGKDIIFPCGFFLDVISKKKANFRTRQNITVPVAIIIYKNLKRTVKVCKENLSEVASR